MGEAQGRRYRVILHKRAAKYYGRQDAKIKERLDRAFEYLKSDPYRGPNIKRLSGELSHLYRYRAGEVRILYEIHEEFKLVRIKAIKPRGEVYR